MGVRHVGADSEKSSTISVDVEVEVEETYLRTPEQGVSSPCCEESEVQDSYPGRIAAWN